MMMIVSNDNSNGNHDNDNYIKPIHNSRFILPHSMPCLLLYICIINCYNHLKRFHEIIEKVI